MACKEHALNIINSVLEYNEKNRTVVPREWGHYWSDSSIYSELTTSQDMRETWARIIGDTYNYVLRQMDDINNLFIDDISVQLVDYKERLNKCLRNCSVICSKIRVLKHISKSVHKSHNCSADDLSNSYRDAEKWLTSDCLDITAGLCVLQDMQYVVEIFSRRLSFGEYVICDNIYVETLDLVKGSQRYPRHVVFDAMEFIIPGTNISVFEFLIMNLDLNHLPILNHEELIIVKFKKLEHLIRDKCRTLDKIRTVHLAINEKCPNFPVECTNHILKM